jgi:hypothetical protein
MARKQSAKESITRFINELVKSRHTTLKSITEAAKVGATFGTAFKSLDLLARKNGVIYYAGPYPIPIAKIEKAYRGIREKHNTPKPAQPPTPTLRQDRAGEKQYTKAEVIAAFKKFYIREYDKMDDRAYTMAGFLLTALDDVL